MTLLSSHEGLLMAGWAASFTVRALEVIGENKDGALLSLEDFMNNPRMDGLFDRERERGDGTIALVKVCLESVCAIKPQSLSQSIGEKDEDIYSRVYFVGPKTDLLTTEETKTQTH